VPGPSLIFSFLLATLIGAGFHLIFGGDARRLAFFLIAGWVGFALGHLFGVLFELDFFNVGALRALPAALGALMTLGVAHVLTSGQSRRRRAS
jgi:uncharacterized membrane protein YjjP (DUF1212 family)